MLTFISPVCMWFLNSFPLICSSLTYTTASLTLHYFKTNTSKSFLSLLYVFKFSPHDKRCGYCAWFMETNVSITDISMDTMDAGEPAWRQRSSQSRRTAVCQMRGRHPCCLICSVRRLLRFSTQSEINAMVLIIGVIIYISVYFGASLFKTHSGFGHPNQHQLCW